MLRDVLAGGRRLHAAIDEEDAAVGADVERVPGGVSALEDAVGGGDLLPGVAQDRVVQLERLGELLVGLGVVAGRGEVGDVEFPEGWPARTERLAFGGSATGERLREPGDDDRFLPFELLQRVGLAVRTDE
jgi:hypothetical protein